MSQFRLRLKIGTMLPKSRLVQQLQTRFMLHLPLFLALVLLLVYISKSMLTMHMNQLKYASGICTKKNSDVGSASALKTLCTSFGPSFLNGCTCTDKMHSHASQRMHINMIHGSAPSSSRGQKRTRNVVSTMKSTDAAGSAPTTVRASFGSPDLNTRPSNNDVH